MQHVLLRSSPLVLFLDQLRGRCGEEDGQRTVSVPRTEGLLFGHTRTPLLLVFCRHPLHPNLGERKTMQGKIFQ